MPKNKASANIREVKKEVIKEKPILIPKVVEEDEEEKVIDPDGILGVDPTEDEEELGLDDDEVDPFGDKWEQ